MKKIVRLTENDLTRIVKKVIKEQATDSKLSVIEKCALGKPQDPSKETIHLFEINELVDKLFNACEEFDKGKNWDEDAIVEALQTTNKSTANHAQRILGCALPKLGIQIQDNNPLLTICRKAFTTTIFGRGMTDFGNGDLKRSAEGALKNLGIYTKI